LFHILRGMPAAPPLPAFKSEASRATYLAAYEAALREWPVPLEEITVPTSFGPTHVVASGDGDAPPLLLLPSLAATALVWRPNIEALSRRFRALAVDVIGQPGKGLALRALHNRGDFARWMADLMDALGVPRASFVGCSFGGFLALSQASLTPERVDKVVLISPAGTFIRLSLTFNLRMRTGRLRRRIRARLGDKRPPEVASLGLKPSLEDAAWRKLMAVTMAESPELNTINADVFSGRELRRIAAPTLLLIGDRERLYDPSSAVQAARRLMPGITAEVVPGADHIAALSQPAWVNERLLGFLAG
jgi:pimeloyl-ACP methyl ester carboxylesterase